MDVLRFFVSMVLLLGLCETKANIEEDGGYVDVSVVVSPEIAYDETRSPQIVQNLVKLIKESSGYLFTATRKNAFLKRVQVVLPESWKNIKTIKVEEKNRAVKFEEADVKIDYPNPIHGHRPYTRQVFGCGIQGDYIHYTPTYLENLTLFDEFGDRRKLFVENWSRLRYGIFDEIGYDGDEIYSKFYYDDDGNVRPTICSDVPSDGRFVELGVDAKDCKFDAKLKLFENNCSYETADGSNVTSSLMSSIEAESFCDSGENVHNVYAPTRQNFLCGFRSTWDVIAESEDLRKIQKPAYLDTSVSIIVHVPLKKTYTFVVDVSSNMGINDTFITWLYAQKNIAQHLKVIAANEIQIVAFGENLWSGKLSEIDPTIINNSPVSCISCGMKKALQKITTDIILVTAGAINETDFTNLERLLKNSSELFVLNVLLYPVLGKEQVKFGRWMALTRDWSGTVTVIDSKERLQIYEKTQVYLTKLYGMVDDGRLETKFIWIENRNCVDFGSDERNHAFFMICTDRSPSITSFDCRNGSKIDMTTNYFQGGKYFKEYANSKLMGHCTYEIKNKKVQRKNLRRNRCLLTTLGITKEVNERIEFSWRHVDGSILLVSSFRTQDRNPIANIEVKAYVRRLEDANKVTFGFMDDDGDGAIDLVKGDGSYAGNLPFPKIMDDENIDGENFTYNIEIHCRIYEAKFIVPNNLGACCGSSMPLEKEVAIEDMQFKIFDLGLFQFPKANNGIKRSPPRIGSLRVEGAPGLKLLNISWIIHRNIVRPLILYKVLLSNSRSALIDGNFTGNVISKDSNGKFLGLNVVDRINNRLTVAVNDTGLWFVAIFARHSYENWGAISNIAQFRIAKKRERRGKEEGGEGDDKPINTSMILVYTGVTILLLALLVLVIFCFVRISTKRKEPEKRVEVEPSRAPSANGSSLKANNESRFYTVDDTLNSLKPREEDTFVNKAFEMDEIPKECDDSPVPFDHDGSRTKSFRRITLV